MFKQGFNESGGVIDRADSVEAPHVILSHIAHRLHVRTFEASFWAAREARDTPAAAFYNQAGQVLFGTHFLMALEKIKKSANLSSSL